ncbi:MAG: hypothetical protein Q8L05_01275 [Actinomycetota bacterium]|nr:hypothetical protein [Actinomycetota bacterium]MDP2288884.1 hypothetical protein [Actinomycetota bacterium]
MVSRTHGRIVRRPSLPLNERDIDDLQALQASEELRQALAELSPDHFRSGPVSESALLHAIWATGMSAIREHAEILGYQALAASMTVTEIAANRAAARRRTPYWADEP